MKTRPYSCLPALAALVLSAQVSQAEQTGTPHRILAADDSTGRLAIIGKDDKVEWEHKVGGIHDAWLLPDGHVLFQQGWQKVVEVDKDKKVVWEFDAAKAFPGTSLEIHAFQRVEDGRTMISVGGVSKIIEVDREGKIVKEIKMQVRRSGAHSDTRLVRKTAAGTYLASHEGDGIVKEYDAEGKVIWDFPIPMFGKEPKGGHGVEAFGNHVFSATRLANGNTLIGTGNGHSVLEVTPKKEIVWKLEQNDLPGIQLAWVCRVDKLANGNIFISNCHAGPANPQMIEVTPDKKVVWTWKDFTLFGNSTPVAAILPDK